jgi:hypothetical protein
MSRAGKRYLNQLIFQVAFGIMAPDGDEEGILESTQHWSRENWPVNRDSRRIDEAWSRFADEVLG